MARPRQLDVPVYMHVSVHVGINSRNCIAMDLFQAKLYIHLCCHTLSCNKKIATLVRSTYNTCPNHTMLFCNNLTLPPLASIKLANESISPRLTPAVSSEQPVQQFVVGWTWFAYFQTLQCWRVKLHLQVHYCPCLCPPYSQQLEKVVH